MGEIVMLPYGTALTIYWARVVIPDDPDACWGWSGPTWATGYGLINVQVAGKQRRLIASRIAYVAHFGIEPTGWVLHHCDNPPCTNPRHIYEGGPWENARDRDSRGHRVIPNNRGARHGLAKLTEAQATEILAAYDGKWGSKSRLARRYGLTQGAMSDLLLGKTWTHLQGGRRGRVRLTETLAREILTRYDGTRGSQTALAQEYGVGRRAIGKLVRRETWKALQ